MQDVLAQPKVRLPFLQRHYHSVITLSLLLADAASIAAGFYLGYRLRLLIPLPDPAAGSLNFSELVPLLALQVLVILTAFFFGRMYHRRRTRYGSDELVTIFSGVSVGTLISIAVASLAFKSTSLAFDYSRGLMIYAWVLTILLVMIARGLQARAQRALQARGYGRTRLVVVGSGDPAVAVLQRIRQNPKLGYDVMGTVAFGGKAPDGAHSLGNIDSLPEVIARRNVDEVIVAVPEASDEEMLRIISMCDRSTMSIKVYPDMFQIMAGQMSIGELGGLPLLNVRDVALRGWKLTLKRAVDLAGSAAGLVLLSPFLVFVAILIKLDSPGPGVFLPGAHGAGRQALLRDQVPLDAPGCRTERPGLDGQGRPAPNPPRGFHAPDEHRRAAAAHQRSDRRDEPGRPAAGTAGLRRGVQQAHPALHGAPPRESRHDGLGATQRPAGRHVGRGAHQVRSMVHRELVSLAGYKNHRPDHTADRPARG